MEGSPIFCYPTGIMIETVVSDLRDEGIRLAFTTLSGENKLAVMDLCDCDESYHTRTSTAVSVLASWLGAYLDAWAMEAWKKKSPLVAVPTSESHRLGSTRIPC